MKKEFLEPSVEVLEFRCEDEIEGSPDQIKDNDGIFGEDDI